MSAFHPFRPEGPALSAPIGGEHAKDHIRLIGAESKHRLNKLIAAATKRAFVSCEHFEIQSLEEAPNVCFPSIADMGRQSHPVAR